MVDIENLKALAETTAGYRNTSAEWPRTPGGQRMADFSAAANPAAVLELIAEIERLREHKEHLVGLRETHGFDSWSAALVQIDQLKVESKSLRKNAARYEWLRNEHTHPGCLSSDPEKAKWLDEYLMCGDKLDAAIDEQLAK